VLREVKNGNSKRF